MPCWVAYVAALAVLGALAPAAAMVGKRYGRTIGGGLALGSLLFGLGRVIDPPSRHAIEAIEDDKKGRPAPGDPPKT